MIAVQLEDVKLNDSFEFYLSNRQIIRTAVIDDSAPEIQSLLHSVIAYTGVTPPEEPEPAPAPEPASAPEPAPVAESAPGWIAEGEQNFLAGAKLAGRLLKRYKGKAERVAIPSAVSKLDGWSCSGQGMKELYLPDSVTEIGEYAFHNCKQLETVRFPTGLRFLRDSAFHECKSLKAVTLPAGEVMGKDVFFGCKNLQSVYLADGWEEVNNGAFTFCKSLAAVRLPAGIRRIGRSAFAWCEALMTITLPEGLAEIAKDAFCSTGIREIAIPGSVKNIEKGAFSFGKLSMIVFGGTKAQWLEANGGAARRGLPSSCIIRCTDGTL